MRSTAVQLEAGEQLRAIYDTIMVESFPPDELISWDELREGVASGELRMYAVYDEAGAVAIAVIEKLSDTVVLLNYFATRTDQRGKGVGTALLSELLESIRSQDAPALILGEVEHPSYREADPAFGDPAARLRFYGRLGARILDVPYFQPPVAADMPAVYGMLLLALEVDPAGEEGHVGVILPEIGLANALETLMGELDREAFPVDALLQAASAEDGVRLLPLSDYEEAKVATPPQ